MNTLNKNNNAQKLKDLFSLLWSGAVALLASLWSLYNSIADAQSDAQSDDSIFFDVCEMNLSSNDPKYHDYYMGAASYEE